MQNQEKKADPGLPPSASTRHRLCCRAGEPRQRQSIALCLGTLAILAAAPLHAAPEDLGRPRGHVTDAAGVLAAEDARGLETYLAQIQTALHVQCAVVIVPSVEPTTIEDYAVRLFEHWGIGDAQRDEGLLLLVAVQERAVRFEVGYGLEGVLPDGRVGRIIRAEILPRFRDGDYAAGILGGVSEAARFIAAEKGVAAPVPGTASRVRRTPDADRSPIRALVLILVVIAVISILGRASRRRGGPRQGLRRRGGWNEPWYGAGLGWPAGRGGGFGGGGFGGGGFGGFGGGASGGGGATGRW